MGYFGASGHFHLLGDQNQKLTLAQLKAVVTDPLLENYREVALVDGRRFYYHPTCALAADDFFVVSPAAGNGRYLLSPGHQNVEIPITFATADAAILATLPTSFLARLERCYWRVTADWTGGSSSSIGLSSSNCLSNTTKGNFQSTSLAAALVATSVIVAGTIGTNIAAGVILRGADTLRFDQLVSAFTAGTGFAGFSMSVIANPGV